MYLVFKKSMSVSFGTPRQHHPSCASTNTLAGDWARQGAPEGTVVSADYQSAGKGRLGRIWDAPMAENLLFSVVLRPPLLQEHYGQVVMAAAVAVSEALAEAIHSEQFQIKWPNDILLASKKVCGMLLETVSGTDALLLGIGVNVNQQLFPDELRPKATSLALFTKTTIDREALMATVLAKLEVCLNRLYHSGIAEIRHTYLHHLAGLGERIRLQLPSGEPSQGFLAGVNEQGHLMVMEKGGIRTYVAGEVSLAGFYAHLDKDHD